MVAAPYAAMISPSGESSGIATSRWLSGQARPIFGSKDRHPNARCPHFTQCDFLAVGHYWPTIGSK